MPTNALQNRLALPMLGLLLEQADHAYGLSSRLSERYPHLRSTRSTVTTLAKSLTAAGLTRPRRSEQVDGRPPRTVYDLTENGVLHIRQRVEETVREAPAMDPDFVTALAYIGVLNRTTALEALRERATRINDETSALRRKLAVDLPPIQMIEVDYWLHMLAAESTWISETAARIESESIAWIGTATV